MPNDAAAAALAALNQTVKKLTEEVAGLANDIRVLDQAIEHAIEVAQRG